MNKSIGRGRHIVEKVKEHKSKLAGLMLGVMAIGVVQSNVAGIPTGSARDGLKTINDRESGDNVKFAGMDWTLLDPDTGLIHLNIEQKMGEGMAFDPNSTNKYDPSESNNIGYYLNETWINSLSVEERGVLDEHSWGIGGLSTADGGYGGVPPKLTIEQQRVKERSLLVNAKVGLLSVSEYRKYSEYYDKGHVKSSGVERTWLLTPATDYSDSVWHVSEIGYLNSSKVVNTEMGLSVRPALYITAGTVLSVDGTILPGVKLPLTAPETTTSTRGEPLTIEQ